MYIIVTVRVYGDFTCLRLQSTESRPHAFTDSQYSNTLPNHFSCDLSCFTHGVHCPCIPASYLNLSLWVSKRLTIAVRPRAPFRLSSTIVMFPSTQLMKSSAEVWQVVMLLKVGYFVQVRSFHNQLDFSG